MRWPKYWSFIDGWMGGWIDGWASKHRQVGCIFIPYGGVLFSPPTNPGSQTLGKVDLEDIFSGVVSTELVIPRFILLATSVSFLLLLFSM